MVFAIMEGLQWTLSDDASAEADSDPLIGLGKLCAREWLRPIRRRSPHSSSRMRRILRVLPGRWRW